MASCPPCRRRRRRCGSGPFPGRSRRVGRGIKQGKYSGKTSQGYAFAFVVKDITCGHTKGLCLKTAQHFEVSLFCNGGIHKQEYADPGPIRVPSNGVVHYTTKVNKNLQTIVMTIKLTTKGTASGTITASGHYCTSNGATGQPVSFTAKV